MRSKSLAQFIYISYMLEHYPNLVVYVNNKEAKMRYDTKYHNRIKVLEKEEKQVRVVYDDYHF